jgi:hypothetical protein
MTPATHCDCGHELNAEVQRRPSATGKCRRCACIERNSDPAICAKRHASLRARYRDPAMKAALLLKTLPAIRAYVATPEGLAERQAQGRRVGKLASGAAKLPAGHEIRLRAGAKRTHTTIGWCPPKLRCRYAWLRARIGKDAARTKIMAEFHENDPFGAQMWRVANGAPIVDKVSFARAEHNFTLGGVSAGMGL